MAFTIPVAVFPTTNFPRILIGVDNGITPINQMLVTVTRPIEEAVNIVPGLQEVRSTTSRGSAEIDLFFDWKVDMFQTLQRTEAALSRVQGSLPSSAKVEARRLTFASFPILGYTLTSEMLPQTNLWQLATYEIKPRLNRLDGVASVLVEGGEVPEFAVAPDPAKLLTAHVTVPDILGAIGRANLISSPGLLDQNHQLFLGLVDAQAHTASDLANIAIKNSSVGVPIHIGDVAEVHPSVKPNFTIVTGGGKPAVLLSINRQPSANTLAVGKEVHAELARLEQSLPPGIKITNYYDQSELVSASIHDVRDTILIGIVLASTVLVIFLRDWGTSLIAGLVIDDAIVVFENIVLHREAGEERLEAVRRAMSELTMPLLGSTFTPIVVFVPLIAITGVTGTFFRALAITMASALLTSLVLALMWTPNLSLFLVRGRAMPPISMEDETNSREAIDHVYLDREEEIRRIMAAEETSMRGFFGRVIRFYERWVRRALDHPLRLAAVCAVLIAVSYFCYHSLGSDMLPAMDEGGFVIDYITPAGSSLKDTDRIVRHILDLVHAIPEVASTSRRTGLQLGLAAVTEANTGDISVKLKTKRSRSVWAIMAQLRQEIAQQEPSVEVQFTQILQDMIGDLTSAPQPINIKLFSPDPSLLAQWAPRVADAISKIQVNSKRPVVDILNGIDNTISGPAVVFKVDPTLAQRAGFTPEEVATDAQAALEGVPATAPVVSADRTYTVRVRFPAAAHSSLTAMSNILLTSATGHTATLGSIAKISELPGQTEITEDNLQRDVTISARLQGLDLGTGVRDAKKVVNGLGLPSSIRVAYGGLYAEQRKSFHDLLVVLIIALVLVFIVLLAEFSNFAAPAAILISALLSTCGVFLALWLTGTGLNISSFMGLIMVVGIVAKNGILLLDADQKFRSVGLSAESAMIQAGRRRLRPIVMTALAAASGMLPLALALGAGSQMLQPLAIAVIGGILISIALSLIVTPAAYLYLSGGRLA